MQTRTLAALAVLAIVAVAAPAPAQDRIANTATEKIEARRSELGTAIEQIDAGIAARTEQRAALQNEIIRLQQRRLVLSGAVEAFGESILAINDAPTTLTATVAEIVATPTPTLTPTPIEEPPK